MNPKHKPWWQYYQFDSEPSITASPLTSEEALKYFIGRGDDIGFLESHTGGHEHIKVLITGTAGIGKTSLVCRYNKGEDNFIRFDFRKAGDFSAIPRFIVDALMLFASRVPGLDISDLERDYNNIISRMSGKEATIGIAPVPVSGTLSKQTTVTPIISPMTIGQQVIERLHAELGYLSYLFDETDHLPGVTKEAIYSIVGYWNFPSPSTAVLTTRNEDATEGWQDSNSIERQTFQFHRKLEPLWVPGTGSAKKLLDVRFDGCFPRHKKWKFPLQDDSTDLIDVLADGNIREFLRYVLIALIAGAKQNQKIPLKPSFIFRILQDEFRSFALDEEERRILGYLRNTPAAVSDKTFLNKVNLKRSTAQNRIDELRDKILITMNVVNQKHIFATTRKANLLLDCSSNN